ncbi:phage protein Gp36 family protein [Larkinella sp. VNQ87]|uniref:phage protein Gp36 family protein n=1 Tax=Larkinella sp. VNQ87 TaxID=3400921 RepID=UPI003C0B5714
MFLTKADLSSDLYPELRELITRYSDTALYAHLVRAEGEIQTYLGARYDIDPELAKTGDNRHKLLLSIAKDLSVYHLYTPLETVPDKRKNRYDQAIRMLEWIAAGKMILPGVPLAPVPEDGPAPGQIAFGYNPRRPTLN